jgi:hypothetical protein
VVKSRSRTLLEAKYKQGGGNMKTKILVFGLVFIFVVLACLCSFADDREKPGIYIPKYIMKSFTVRGSILNIWVQTKTLSRK